MIKLRLKEFEMEHLDEIGDLVEPLWYQMSSEWIVDRGLSLTLTLDDKIIACGGLSLIGEDKAEAWARISSEALNGGMRVRIEILKAIRNGLDLVDKLYGFPRIGATVLDGFAMGDRMARHLGFTMVGGQFEHEGKLYNFYRRMYDGR